MLVNSMEREVARQATSARDKALNDTNAILFQSTTLGDTIEHWLTSRDTIRFIPEDTRLYMLRLQRLINKGRHHIR